MKAAELKWSEGQGELIEFVQKFMQLGSEENLPIEKAQSQLLFLYFMEGKTPNEAIEGFKKVMIRVNAIEYFNQEVR